METSISTSSESNKDQLAPSQDKRLQTHIDRAEVISRYGDALKKFDWLFYMVAAFMLFIISLLSCHFLGATSAGMCTSMMTAALYLLKRKTS